MEVGENRETRGNKRKRHARVAMVAAADIKKGVELCWDYPVKF